MSIVLNRLLHAVSSHYFYRARISSSNITNIFPSSQIVSWPRHDSGGQLPATHRVGRFQSRASCCGTCVNTMALGLVFIRVPPIPCLHTTLNITPISDFIYHLTDKFFGSCPAHPNPLIRSIGNYSLADFHRRYKKYIHKRPKHILL